MNRHLVATSVVFVVLIGLTNATANAAPLHSLTKQTERPGTRASPRSSPTLKPIERPGRYTPRRIIWRTCANAGLKASGIQCGTLTVPLDYSKPRGSKIRLAVSRLKHRSSAAAYQGVMIVNPGGPGGSGLFLPIIGSGGIIPGTGDDTYNWIGFDPRGVGDSRPAVTCDSSFSGTIDPTTCRRAPDLSWFGAKLLQITQKITH